MEKKEIKKAREILNYQDNKKIDYVTLGCPHLSPEEVKILAGMVNGKKGESKDGSLGLYV